MSGLLKKTSISKLIILLQMAKIKNSIMPLSGKVDDLVHINSKRYGKYVRKAVAKGSSKNNPVLKTQYDRNGVVNGLASEINTIIKNTADTLRPTKFYENLLKRLRKEPLDNRFMLLRTVIGMEVSDSYRLCKLGSQSVTVEALDDKFVVRVRVLAHPDAGKQEADGYFYEVLFVTWAKSNKPPVFSIQPSDWIDMKGGKPTFPFEFARDEGVVHWMVCLRLKLGLKQEEIGTMAAEGMAVVDVGSLDEGDLALVRERGAVVVEGKSEKVKEVVRVKAERME
jgi:hypothetical protein